MTTLATLIAAVAVLIATPALIRRLAATSARPEAGTFDGLDRDLEALLATPDATPLRLAA